jgi:hypothetical protein
MLKLTDDELTRIFQATAPIAIERRDDFLEAVAAILLGSAGPIGSGTVHRARADPEPPQTAPCTRCRGTGHHEPAVPRLIRDKALRPKYKSGSGKEWFDLWKNPNPR